MKWVLSIAVFCSIVASSCQSHVVSELKNTTAAMTEIDASELQLNQDVGLVFYEKVPFSGVGLKYYHDSIIAEMITYQNGKRVGELDRYFPDGSLSFSAFYVNGRLDGDVKSWWSNGNLRSHGKSLLGVPDGEQLQFYKSGQLFKQINIANGSEHGMQRSWRENGTLYNNYEAKNGRIFGLKRSKLCFSLENEIVQYET